MMIASGYGGLYPWDKAFWMCSTLHGMRLVVQLERDIKLCTSLASVGNITQLHGATGDVLMVI